MLDNLKTLHDAMITGLRAGLADISHIDAYLRIGRKIPTPSIAVELTAKKLDPLNVTSVPIFFWRDLCFVFVESV